MYNRYIPEDVSYARIEEHIPPPHHDRPVPEGRPPRAPFRVPELFAGKEALSGLLKSLSLDKIDSGDILLLLIALYLLVEGDDPELAIALGLTVFLGLGEDG